MNEPQFQRILLDAAAEHAQRSPEGIQQYAILRNVAERLGIRFGDTDAEQVLLAAWSDLFRNGHLAWGHNLLFPDPPFVHLTEQGRTALQRISRDPANPDGYLSYLRGRVSINPIAESYIIEGLRTYNTNCFKAAAVMVGAAAESVILQLRDTLVAQMRQAGKSIPGKLEGWGIKTALDAVHDELEPHRQNMPRSLAESFLSLWPAFAGQIRLARSDAGHPIGIEPVTSGIVQAQLLIFPELAMLASELGAWIMSTYT